MAGNISLVNKNIRNTNCLKNRIFPYLPCTIAYQKESYDLASVILNNNIFSTFLGVSFFHTRSNAAMKQKLF